MAQRGGLSAYLAAAMLARSATETAGPALLIVAIAVLGNSSDGPYLAAALTGAAAIAGPVVGALLDRTPDPRPGLRASVLLMGAGLATIALLIGRAPLWVLLAIAAIAGLGYPGVTGALTAQLPHIVEEPNLPRAYSADAGTYSLASIIGPPVAAALLAVGDVAPLWLPVALLMLSLIALPFVRITPHHRDLEHSLVSDLRHGFDTIVRRPALRRTVILTTVSFIGQAALFVCAPLIAQRLTGSLSMTGILFGAIAAGGVVAALWLMRRPMRHPDRVVLWATIANGLLILVAGLAQDFAIVLVAAFLLGLTELPQLSATFLIRGREAGPRVRSQVFTTSASLRTTAFAIGSALFGAMLVLGEPTVIVTGFAFYVVSVIAALLVGPGMSRRRGARDVPPTLGA